MAYAIILSGGVGLRMRKSIPKQYIEVNGKPIINYCLDKFENNIYIDGIVIVADPKWRDFIVKNFEFKKKYSFADPGTTRQLSILNALRVIKNWINSDNDIVIIHDAVRPLISNDLISNCLRSCQKYDGVLPIIPVKDTIYQSIDGKVISSLLPRNELFCGQAPEAFNFKKYLRIHEEMPIDKISLIKGSTEIAYNAGLDIALIEGDEMNFKITTNEDLKTFETIIK